MKSYLLKLSGREDGPFPEVQIAQMFADQQVDRYTPCKPETSGEWKTIDDYLPMLKYGTQLPAPSKPPPIPSQIPSASLLPSNSVQITDVDVPFFSVLKMVFKIFAAWLIVACCFIPVMIALWFFIFAAIFAFFGHAFSASQHP